MKTEGSRFLDVSEAGGMPAVPAPCPSLNLYTKTTLEVPLPEPYETGHCHDLRISTGLELQQPTVFVARGVELPLK